jgi:hypothetical protein
MQELNFNEHTPQSKGARIDTGILVLRPVPRVQETQAQAPSPAKPRPATTVSVDFDHVLTKSNVGQHIIFLLKIPIYSGLPEHEREPINMAWRQAKHGRSAKRVFWKNDVIFILTPDQTAPTNPNAATHLQEALEAADAGRLISDPYEVKRALGLADKFGTDVTAASTR